MEECNRYVVVNVWEEIEYRTSSLEDAFDRLDHCVETRESTDGPFRVYELKEVTRNV